MRKRKSRKKGQMIFSSGEFEFYDLTLKVTPLKSESFTIDQNSMKQKIKKGLNL